MEFRAAGFLVFQAKTGPGADELWFRSPCPTSALVFDHSPTVIRPVTCCFFAVFEPGWLFLRKIHNEVRCLLHLSRVDSDPTNKQEHLRQHQLEVSELQDWGSHSQAGHMFAV